MGLVAGPGLIRAQSVVILVLCRRVSRLEAAWLRGGKKLTSFVHDYGIRESLAGVCPVPCEGAELTRKGYGKHAKFAERR